MLRLESSATQPLDEPAGRQSRRSPLHRAFFGAVGLVAIAIVTTAVWELRSRQRDIVGASIATNAVLADHAANGVSDYVDDIERQITAAAESLALREQPFSGAARLALLELQRTAPPITAAAIADHSGIEVARQSRDQFIDPGAPSDLSATVAFQRALSGQVYRSRVYFVRNSEPYLTISAPIHDVDGRFAGAIIAEVSLRGLMSVLSELVSAAGTQAYVVTGDGELIGHKDLSMALSRLDLSEISHVSRALGRSSPDLTTRPGAAGDPTIAAHASIPSLDWFVILEFPANEVLAPVRAAAVDIGAQMAVAFLLLATAAIWLNRRFLRPAMALSHTAKRMRAGVYTERAAVGVDDEHADIADTLNLMSARLGDFHTLLTEQVHVRTGEITTALQAALTYSDSLGAQGGRLPAPLAAATPAAEAVLLLQRMISEGQTADPLLAASLEAALCESLVRAGRPADAEGAFRRAIDRARPLGATAMLPALCAILGARAYPDLLATRLDAGRMLTSLAADAPPDSAAVDALFWHANDLVEVGDLAAARQLFDMLGEPGGQASGPTLLGVRARQMAASLSLSKGVDNATADLIDAARAAEIRYGYKELSAGAGLQLAILHRERGHLHNARAVLDGAGGNAFVWRALSASLHCDDGHLSLARDEFEDIAAAGFDSIPRDAWTSTSLAFLAQTCAHLGDATRAKALYMMLQPYEGRNIAGDAICLGGADRYLGILAAAANDFADAERHLTSAIEFNHDLPVWRAWATFNLAGVNIARQQREGASELLDQCLDAARPLGLAKLREGCLALLSKEPQTGPRADGLTVAELRVLRLLPSGFTNRDIGERLHLSPNTVANHVRNILAKTGARNRTEAANYARRHSIATDEPRRD